MIVFLPYLKDMLPGDFLRACAKTAFPYAFLGLSFVLSLYPWTYFGFNALNTYPLSGNWVCLAILNVFVYCQGRWLFLWVFFLAIIAAVMAGEPLGLRALIYSLNMGIVSYQTVALRGKSFWVLWAASGLLLGLSAILQWGCESLLRQAIVNPVFLMGQVLFTWVCYPLVARFFIACYKRLYT